MKRPAILIALCLAGLLAGCAVGPNYKPPASTLSNQWVSPSDKWLLSSTQEEAAWWKGFNDETLNSLVDRAVAGNLDLKIAESRVKEAREARIIASQGLLPRLGLGGSFTRTRRSQDIDSGARSPKVVPGQPLPPIPPGSTVIVQQGPRTIPRDPDPHTNLYEGGFDASWELDFFGRIRRAREAATADIEAQRESQRDVLVTLLGEVARNYVELRGTQKAIEVTRANADSQKSTLDLTQTRARAGLATELDVARAESQLAATESDLPSLQINERQVIHRLGVLLGQEPGQLLEELSTPVAIPSVPAEVRFNPPANLIRRRPDIRRAERDLAATTARIGAAQGELYPKFVINGSLGLAASDLGDLSTGSSKTWSIGPSVSVPLFNAGALRAQVRAARDREEQALSAYQKTILSALEEAENALTGLSREQERRDSLARAVAADRRAVNLSRDLYKQGLIDFLSVLEAERSLFRSEFLLVRSEASVSNNLVVAYKAMGGGWEGFLPLDPAEQEAEATKTATPESQPDSATD